jgi:UPF0755 protein
MHELRHSHKQQPINGTRTGLKHPKRLDFGKVWVWLGGIVASVLVLVFVGALVWYNVQLSPAGSDLGRLKKINIPPGSTSSQISKELEKQGIIRNATAFDIYVRLSGKNNVLKAGSYRLSSAESTQAIVEHFVKGSVDTFSITFYPGATLVDNSDKSKAKKYDVTTVLEKAGFSASEIADGLAAKYVDSSYAPLFTGKPSNADLEGYVYGETYNFNIGASVHDILESTFKEFYVTIKKYDLANGFSKQGLSLYQGITLASIIQREANKPEDQKQVAQVFYKRLSIGMMLGSDVTYQYIADKTGVARDPNLDSPYNTRRFAGLPPGPISVPGLTALQAAASPASGDYLYFLSGDDDVTYFAKTNEEHEANIAAHCKIKCSTP